MTIEAISTEVEAALMYQAVGASLGHWIRVEDSLFYIFASCLGPCCASENGTWTGGGGGMSALFASVETLRVRTNMISAMINSLMSTDDPADTAIKALWKKECEKVNKCAQNRNKLAHWEVTLFNDKAPMRRARLMPAHQSPEYAALTQTNEPGFTITDVNGWGESFAQAATRLKPIYLCLAMHERLQNQFIDHVEAQKHNRQWMKDNPFP